MDLPGGALAVEMVFSRPSDLCRGSPLVAMTALSTKLSRISARPPQRAEASLGQMRTFAFKRTDVPIVLIASQSGAEFLEVVSRLPAG